MPGSPSPRWPPSPTPPGSIPTERHVGFIAEDVPDLVATPDRQSLSPMDIVAVLTRVVQEQQAAIADLRAEIAGLRRAAER